MIPLNWEADVSGTTTKQLSRIREGEIHFKESKDKVTKGAMDCKLALRKAGEKEEVLAAEEGPKTG